VWTGPTRVTCTGLSRTMPKLSAGFIWPDLTSQLIADLRVTLRQPERTEWTLWSDGARGRQAQDSLRQAAHRRTRTAARHAQKDNGSRIHCGISLKRRSAWASQPQPATFIFRWFLQMQLMSHENPPAITVRKLKNGALI
jgi:hypothetical protein